MTQPTPYNRQTSFALFSAQNPSSQQSGVDLDTEFNAVKVSLDDTQSNLKRLQADDGTLRAATVGLAQFDASVTLGVRSKGVWVTATAYTANVDTVFNTTKIYLCLVSHTAGVFATDLAAGKWLQIADLGVQVLDVNTVAETNLQTDSVSARTIQASAVGNSELASGAVDLGKLAASLQAYLVPAGKIGAYAGTTLPAGWLWCNGASVLRSDYPALFTAVGTFYGSADGTHFNVPNLMGRQIVCQDGMNGAGATGLVTTAGSSIDALTLGATGGAQTKTLTTAQLPVITPAGAIGQITPAGTVTTTLSAAASSVVNGAAVGGGANMTGGGGALNSGAITAASTFAGTPVTPVFTGTPFGSGTAHSTMDPSIVLPFIIKAH